MKLRDILADPDLVGSSEYRAVHDCIYESLTDVVLDDPLTPDEIEFIGSMLDEFASQVQFLKVRFAGACRKRARRSSRG